MDIAPCADLAPVRALLHARGLPTADLHRLALQDVLCCGRPEDPDGVVALEMAPPEALLRSLAVREDRAGQGQGRALVQAVERLAVARGLSRLFLLTETATAFFARIGYAPVARDAVPEAIRATTQFSSLCPDSAIVMTRSLEGSSP